MITAGQFKEATGREPEQDDLDRCNCPLAGKIGHWFCGWDSEANLPVFMATEFKEHAAKNRCNTTVTNEREYAGRPRNFYEPPFMTMIDSGTFWRCFHGVTRFGDAGCPHCKKDYKG
jgi:hypothetical protein